MTLIVGLGNPGEKYQKTRHNIGFMAIDKLLADGGWPSAVSKKFQAETAETKKRGEKIFFLKPRVFMNESGGVVSSVARFHKIKPTDIWLIHDDLDLPLGVFKIQKNRSSAGHKGVQSVIDCLGTKDFIRFRLGIGSGRKRKGAGFVLSGFSGGERKIVEKTLADVSAAVQIALEEGAEKAMNVCNHRRCQRK